MRLAERRVWRVSKDGPGESRVALPSEAPLSIEVDGRQVAVLMRTPGDDMALALGYCLSEGLIHSLADVLLLHHCGSGDDAELLGEAAPGAPGGGDRVRLMLTPEAQARLAPGLPVRWVFSGCGGVDRAALAEGLRVQGDGVRVAAETLFGLVPAMSRVQAAYRAAGGIHCAGLFDAGGAALAISEDVGRHNAADKAIGTALLAGRLPGAILAATGRASSDIVAKAARAGVAIVASFSSSTSLGVELAEAAGVTLVGYLRRNRCTVYTHPQRIIYSGPHGAFNREEREGR